MTKELQALRNWLREQAEIPLGQLSTIHLDELGFDWKRLRTTAALGEVFAEGAREVAGLGESLKFFMVLQLERSRRLFRPRERGLDALMSKLSSMEPPPIYLLRPHQFLGSEMLEEYRLPLAFPCSSLDPESWRSYLRQFRDMEYLEKDWEYENSICLEQICWVESPDGAGRVAV